MSGAGARGVLGQCSHAGRRSAFARAPERAAAGLALVLVMLAGAARAHTRSQSFSTWDVRGGEVTAVFSAPAVEATRLGSSAGDADLAGAFAAHLAARVSVERGGAPCSASAPRPLAARTGYLRIELRFACAAAGALRITNEALFDAAPSHVHTARVRIGARPAIDLLFKASERVRTIGGESADPSTGASLAAYVRLGVEHIAGGADHVAFLVALLLLCRRLRDVVFLVTGFTVGHSVTLALAVLGVVRPDVPVVEALIGFTIALVAAENVGVRAGAEATIALVAAAGIAALALLRAATGAGLPFVTLAGLALFSVCHLRLARTEAEAARLRPLLTLLFGLVHGLGFASVLLEVGLPRDRVAAALFGFNLGVEIGQLAIVSALWAAGRFVVRRFGAARDTRLAFDAVSAALCALGLFWFVGRSLAP